MSDWVGEGGLVFAEEDGGGVSISFKTCSLAGLNTKKLIIENSPSICSLDQF